MSKQMREDLGLATPPKDPAIVAPPKDQTTIPAPPPPPLESNESEKPKSKGSKKRKPVPPSFLPDTPDSRTTSAEQAEQALSAKESAGEQAAANTLEATRASERRAEGEEPLPKSQVECTERQRVGSGSAAALPLVQGDVAQRARPPRPASPRLAPPRPARLRLPALRHGSLWCTGQHLHMHLASISSASPQEAQ